MARLSISCLGPLQITLDGRAINGFAYNKARALLVYLAVEADRAHSRESLVTLFWPDLPESAARTNLRQVLANLREVLGDVTAHTPFLLVTRDTLQLNPASEWRLDVNAFDALIAGCHAHAHRHLARCRSCETRLVEATALYRGDFLAELSLVDSQALEEWELWRRERLHQRALEALALLVTTHERRGADEQARHYARRQIELDPWREEAHRDLMRLLARAGQRSAALAQYDACRRVLAESLGVQPTPETQALCAAIQAGSLPDTRPALARGALPTLSRPLVGRSTEQAELTAWLEDPAYRLITLTGPGGIGKTSLALAVAGEMAGSFETGAAWVALADISNPAELAPAVLQALEIPAQGHTEATAQLVTALRDRELLLVLDNVESLLEASGEAVRWLAALLLQAPRVTCLVTSRERLGLQAEWVYSLDGLARPTLADMETAATYDAVRLFVERARQVDRRFALEAEGVRAVVQFCDLVDGLPLAIELAAAQVRTDSVSVMAADLAASLRELTTDLHDVPERQRSLWATFEYSWQRLSADEQDVLRRLAVFRGGFERAAADQVAGANPERLTALIDRSLVRVAPPASEAAGTEARYQLHAMTRQYALMKLAGTPEDGATRERHASFFRTLAETAEPQLTGPDQVVWLNRLEREHANLRDALSWALDGGASETAARLGGALWRFWWLHSHLVEGRIWLERILALGPEAPPATRAQVHNGAGVLANDLGDYAAAADHHRRALTLRRELGDTLGMARSLGNLGNTARQLGDLAGARTSFSECLALFRSLNHEWGIATTLLNLGVIADDGALDEQEALYAESMDIYRRLGDRHGMSIVIGNLGEIALRRRHFADARGRYAEYIELSQVLGDTPSVAHSLMMLGILALEEHRPRTGARCFGAAARLRETSGVPVLAAYVEEYERYRETARAALGDTDFDAAWAAGGAWPLERVVLPGDD